MEETKMMKRKISEDQIPGTVWVGSVTRCLLEKGLACWVLLSPTVLKRTSSCLDFSVGSCFVLHYVVNICNRSC